jgi:predicted metalloprotease
VKWKRTKSRDVIDIRGARGGRRGGGMSLPGGMAGVGGGAGLVVILVVLGIQLLGGGGAAGFDVGQVLSPGTGAPGAGDPQPIPPGQDPQRDLKDFSTYVFEDSQGLWRTALESEGQPYEESQMVLYSGAVSTEGCGGATSAVGPFYCPADNRIYLDLSFYEDMRRQLGASGDFAWAYVIAHEMGHHVQNVVGTSDEVRRLERENPDEANELSVRLELQADCYSGFWASTVFEAGDLEKGDLNEAFTAAEAVGDDRLQSQAGGSVNPDSFTHGTSEQRRRWFTRGYKSADAGDCDTFAADEV